MNILEWSIGLFVLIIVTVYVVSPLENLAISYASNIDWFATCLTIIFAVPTEIIYYILKMKCD